MRKRITAAAVCLHNGKLLTVEVQDPTSANRFLVVPGGAIEGDESALQAAVRETREETGYHVRSLHLPAIFISYSFVWDGIEYERETTLIACELDESQIKPDGSVYEPADVKDAPYILGHRWLLLEDLDEAFSYKEQLREAISQLVQLQKGLSGRLKK